MDQNNLKQKDLVGIIGRKSAVSEILNGKRPLHLNHIRKLAKKFHVKPALLYSCFIRHLRSYYIIATVPAIFPTSAEATSDTGDLPVRKGVL
jgi:transcriptional regulator with XRE-family HTH domain